jgi:alanine dehydrogenase
MYSLIVNCMYWEKRFPRLLSTKQLQDLIGAGCPLVGISDITCDIGGSMEFVNQTTSIDSPFFRYIYIYVYFFFFVGSFPLHTFLSCSLSCGHCTSFGEHVSFCFLD